LCKLLVKISEKIEWKYFASYGLSQPKKSQG
jgi:hypothetical protein